MKFFFPFSHITQAQLTTLSAFFSNIGFFPLTSDFHSDPVLASLTEKGILNPLFSSAKDLMEVEKQVQSYLDWAGLHKGNENNLKSLVKEHPYYSAVTDLARVQSQIKGGTRKALEPKEPEEPENPEINPLLLLKFAQLLDIQNEEIEDKLQKVEQRKAFLFSQLKGEDREENSAKAIPGFHDPGMVMTQERVNSWVRYADEKGIFKEEGLPPVLITTSPAVLDYLMSKTRDVINALDIDFIKVHENGCFNKQGWQQDLHGFLEEAIAGRSASGIDLPGADDPCTLTGQIKLCIFPGGDINTFFNIPGKQLVVCLVTLKS